MSAAESGGESKASAAARLQKELMELMRSQSKGLGISAFPVNNDLFAWAATIKGIAATPYADLEYKLSLKFPDNYPFSAPVVTFLTPCFHPNVDATHGHICLDILKENWSAVYSVSSILLSIQNLLDCPNNHSPLNGQAAQMWGQGNAYRNAVLAMHNRG